MGLTKRLETFYLYFAKIEKKKLSANIGATFFCLILSYCFFFLILRSNTYILYDSDVHQKMDVSHGTDSSVHGMRTKD